MILRLVLTFFMLSAAYVSSLTHNEVDMKLRNAMRLELDETIDTGTVGILRSPIRVHVIVILVNI